MRKFQERYNEHIYQQSSLGGQRISGYTAFSEGIQAACRLGPVGSDCEAMGVRTASREENVTDRMGIDTSIVQDQSASSANHAPGAQRLALTRRHFLLVTSSYLAAACAIEPRSQDSAAAQVIDLERFLRLSRVLAGVEDLRDESIGREYLAAILNDPERAAQLAALWRAGRFEGPDPPTSVADLAARGVYEVLELADLADTITAYWYTGSYLTTTGERRVATYTDALAWQTLGYRPAGPSACGGAFGHWADRPPGA